MYSPVSEPARSVRDVFYLITYFHLFPSQTFRLFSYPFFEKALYALHPESLHSKSWCQTLLTKDIVMQLETDTNN